MTSRTVVFGCVAWLLIGCSSGRLGDVPAVLAPENKAEIVVVRDDSLLGAAISYIVEIDEAEVFALRGGQYTRIPLPPGDYILSVTCRGGRWIAGEKQHILARLEPGEPFYARLRPALRCGQIERVDAATAGTLLRGKRYVPFE